MVPMERFQTSIRVSRETWRALRALAEARAERVGGRPSASAVITELVATQAARVGKVKARADA